MASYVATVVHAVENLFEHWKFVLMKMKFVLFREVFKAKEKANPKKFVAMKKVLMDNEKEGVRLLF